MNHRHLAALAVVILSGPAAIAQDRPASPEARFEVASVKANPRDDTPEGIVLQPNGGVRFTSFHVRTLITIAYRSAGIQRFDQLVGAPSWIAVDRFDIVAKAEGETAAPDGPPNRLPEMLRTLLRERFHLQLHPEMRKMPAFALVIARHDRRLGPQLHESTTDCSINSAGAAVTNAEADRVCGIHAVGGVITGRFVSASQLAGNLSGYPAVDRFVSDRTGLTGRYDFRLEYSPAFLQPGDAVSNAGPSLFTALTEQLGLTLQAASAVVPVLVIDTVAKPTAD